MRRQAVLAVLVFLSSVVAHAQEMTTGERQRLLAHLEMTSRWLTDEVADLSPAQLAFKRSADEWSIAQVIDHLLVVGPIYWDDLQAAIKAGSSTQSSAFSDADILWYGIDRGNREKAIPTEVPAGRFSNIKEALAEYRKTHERLVAFVKSTDAPLRRRFVPRQSSDAYQWALLISTHEQRHILQIREIKSADKFPAR